MNSARIRLVRSEVRRAGWLRSVASLGNVVGGIAALAFLYGFIVIVLAQAS